MGNKWRLHKGKDKGLALSWYPFPKILLLALLETDDWSTQRGDLSQTGCFYVLPFPDDKKNTQELDGALKHYLALTLSFEVDKRGKYRYLHLQSENGTKMFSEMLYPLNSLK